MASSHTKEEKLNSLIVLAQAIVTTDAIEVCKKSLLNQIIWDVTLLDHTWNMRYWSETIYHLVQEYGSFNRLHRSRTARIRREHVNTRKLLVTYMLDNPSEIPKY